MQPVQQITAHKQKTFVESAKRFLNHKLILANVSHYYKCDFKKNPIDRIKTIFGKMLVPASSYPAGQWALYIKRHEDLIQAILPVPGNPSYQSSLKAANDLIQTAGEIVDALNLKELV